MSAGLVEVAVNTVDKIGSSVEGSPVSGEGEVKGLL